MIVIDIAELNVLGGVELDGEEMVGERGPEREDDAGRFPHSILVSVALWDRPECVILSLERFYLQLASRTKEKR